MTYICTMFPYPSAAGLHLGHYYNYAIADSICRWKRYKGEEVFQPFGYDAFGLPAENYAKKVGGDPREITYQNIDNFRKQFDHMNTEYDEKLITSDESYYRWTQWLFSLLHARGLAYKAKGNVNYCPDCQTVLANEQVKDNRCERCDTVVQIKNQEQWYFAITDYKDRLLVNLDDLDYPEGTIKQQRAWLENLHDWCVSRQRSWGTPIPIDGETDTLDTFVDSSFYYLRYLTNSTYDFLPMADYKQVDLYIGGPEHACMHLIYARFIHMFLYDIGIVPVEEPFKKVIHQGMITKDGAKMSKSKGNVVDPMDYDSDELRMYLMFIGHYFDGGEWDDKNIKGIRRFLGRMGRWLADTGEDDIDTDDLLMYIDGYMNSFKVNKVVSTFMEFYNTNKGKRPTKECAAEIEEILQNFAPSFEIDK